MCLVLPENTLICIQPWCTPVEKCDHEEVYRVFEKCAEHDTVLFIHHRGEMQDLSDSHELIADVAATGAKLQVGKRSVS